jgi:hypothetical protein
MTKQQELDILQDAITKLGPNSYLGPWLAGVKAEVGQCITCDTFPDISLRDAAQRAKGIVELAEESAQRIREGSARHEKQANASLAKDIESTARVVAAARVSLVQVESTLNVLYSHAMAAAHSPGSK